MLLMTFSPVGITPLAIPKTGRASNPGVKSRRYRVAVSVDVGGAYTGQSQNFCGANELLISANMTVLEVPSQPLISPRFMFCGRCPFADEVSGTPTVSTNTPSLTLWVVTSHAVVPTFAP